MPDKVESGKRNEFVSDIGLRDILVRYGKFPGPTGALNKGAEIIRARSHPINIPGGEMRTKDGMSPEELASCEADQDEAESSAADIRFSAAKPDVAPSREENRSTSQNGKVFPDLLRVSERMAEALRNERQCDCYGKYVCPKCVDKAAALDEWEKVSKERGEGKVQK